MIQNWETIFFLARQHAMHAERDIVLPILSVRPSAAASNTRGRKSLQISPFFSETVRDMAIVTMEH